jgi:peptidyl-prolyl cis-trans isomerase A (cyclophilin A)
MKRRFVLAAFAALALAGGVTAAPPRKAHPAPAPIPLADVVRVALVTDQGTILLDLDGKHAPITTANFLHYVDTRRLDGATFYRAMHLAWGTQPNGLLQGGMRDPRLLFPPIAHEPTSQTGILHTAGTISMARNAPGSATADFSILLADMPGLNANPAAPDPDAQAGYAAFGHVAGGMDVVQKIWDMPRSDTAPVPAMKGQMLSPPVRITSARRVPLPAPTTPPAAMR